MAHQPNILFFHVDNLGFGELSCYAAGSFRGATTARIDAFAAEGFRLTNYCPESQCTPTRSALLTGRHAIRSGTHTVPIGVEGGWGLVAWEKTLGELLDDAGYRCATYGKWHVGEGPGRWPTDRGFEEWYGHPRTYDEALWPDDPWYDPERDPVSTMVHIKRGDDDVTPGDALDLDVRRDCDLEYLDRAEAFVRSAVETEDPFFLYFNHSLMHFPVIPRAEFRGRSGQGEWADSLLELDADFGRLLDLLDELGIADDTVVVFAGDNGPEDFLPWRGSPGFWRGSYFAGGEGNLRTPCIVRWPERVPAGRTSDEIMHVTDWFTTLLAAAGVAVPDDRVIDGADQLDWLTGGTESSARDGYLYWMGSELYGVKWRNFKLVQVEQESQLDAPARLATPRLVNLTVDPHEREPVNYPYLHTWVATHVNRLVQGFRRSVREEPMIPVGAPLDHVPTRREQGMSR
ncbi:sulfatase-like hydrolase/transferase [Nocardioides sp. MAH-18]|uniref:Sulfatase-like hydrolase/transferase n=1 Tax=Nocardioides agri TaxID=2682843 RepID=A0A6L6XMC8_9ACTN|nr:MULTISPECIES: sulfatase-like hydrolase/transferase [unclassified Nocardioides]MBA2953229.1 sulfatase-like hydrolase/transferase [Nocardioides sp. CGMCC 1.13656]MVQ48098.1 sulfatase-like hydrolase/transferase [Nocardioides sp. MAH-18]